MKKVWTTLCFALVVALFALRPNPANALLAFKKEFDKKYTEGTTAEQQALAKAVTTAKCYVCHDPKKGPDGLESKKNHNPYGEALKKYLHKKDIKDVAKIQKALETVEAEKGPDGKAWGERIKTGKLPFETK